jgi:hypothetical protein
MSDREKDFLHEEHSWQLLDPFVVEDVEDVVVVGFARAAGGVKGLRNVAAI